MTQDQNSGGGSGLGIQLEVIVSTYPVVWCEAVTSKGEVIATGGKNEPIFANLRRVMLGTDDAISRLFQFASIGDEPRFISQGNLSVGFLRVNHDCVVAMFGDKKIPPWDRYEMGIKIRREVFLQGSKPPPAKRKGKARKGGSGS
jgi:hypothetical protein